MTLEEVELHQDIVLQPEVHIVTEEQFKTTIQEDLYLVQSRVSVIQIEVVTQIHVTEVAFQIPEEALHLVIINQELQPDLHTTDLQVPEDRLFQILERDLHILK